LESELIEKARAGDREALVRVIMDHKEQYYRLAYVYTRNREDAMDAMADMIVIIYENIGKLKNPGSFHAWSKTILVNCSRKIKKRRRRLVTVEKVPEIAYQERYENSELNHDLQRHLECLSSRQKEVIQLRYFMDLDYRTIAGLLGIPVGTVKSRISIGLRRLKDSFGGGY
jgi:RNA polymerase sigma-70 factor (ECF subfamily)